jgi:hypothetical protein
MFQPTWPSLGNTKRIHDTWGLIAKLSPIKRNEILFDIKYKNS